ncbi:thioredoxin family protein [Sulfurospirillum oryzae]|uniref:thioredoxin family protein n=1 Tax=Sulfurospirillum oryzae TaxID=2976535 RepID=UPI0021E98A47|nr:thioredoxin family protein [Sulfurospirillum oryzae]
MNTLLKALFVTILSLTALQASFLEAESAKAFKEKKLILVNIVSEDCPYCKQMAKEVFNNPTYRKQIDKKYVFVTLNQMDPTLPADLRTRYVPANAIMSPKGLAFIDGYTGYMEPTAFMKILDEVYKAEFK